MHKGLLDLNQAPRPVIYNWSGFYIGANGGWGSSHNCSDFVTLLNTTICGWGSPQLLHDPRFVGILNNRISQDINYRFGGHRPVTARH